MRKSYFIVLFLFFVVSGSGCASIINGTTQKVPVNTTPKGAVASLHDGINCKTPCSLELKRNTDYIMTIQKEGYEDTSITFQRVMSGVIAGNLLLGGIIGAGVDAASGAMYRFTPESVTVDLKLIAVQIEKPGLTVEKLKDLEELRKANAITAEEYARLKEKLLENFEKKL